MSWKLSCTVLRGGVSGNADSLLDQKMTDGRKQPFYISSRDGNPLSFAGIWDSVTTKEGERLDSCAILTADCNALMQPIHDRMPVVLAAKDWDIWLDPKPSTDEALLPLLKPFAPDLMQLWAVSPAVGRVSNQGEVLIRPVNLMAKESTSGF